MRYVLLAILVVGVAACNSDNATKPYAPTGTQKLVADLRHEPVDPQQLVGRWEGTYKFTWHQTTNRPRATRFNIQMEFTDTSYQFREVPWFGVCSNYGGGPYWVENREIRFEDHLIRNQMCMWYLLYGSFSYRTNHEVTLLSMIQQSGDFRVHVKLRKVGP